MTTLITIFGLAFLAALIITPAVRSIALKYRLFDKPEARKIHLRNIPRIGGVAIFISFFLPFGSIYFYSTEVLKLIQFDYNLIYLIAGAVLAFGIGLADDIWGVRPGLKLMAQATAALLAISGGVWIQVISFGPGHSLHFGALSLPVTVFWFLLMINAINLIDGLDGLAAGITFFVCAALIVLCTLDQKLFVAMGLAALGGACFGFLRYNFNPATIFMGDSGSYFIGYLLAAFSVIGAVKSQAAAAGLIPLIALGVPLFDTLWAPIRRFLLGRKLFSPDREHLHHKLLNLGFSHRKAVLLLYAATIILGVLSLMLIHSRDDRAALILFIIGAMLIFGVRKLGYFDYIATDKLIGWLRDVTDEAGISRERRTFLSLQIDISKSQSIPELWRNICQALEKLGFDMAEMRILAANSPYEKGLSDKLFWCRNGFDSRCDIAATGLMKLQLPLVHSGVAAMGDLCLIKDLTKNEIGHYTLRRVEHLRRTIMGTLKQIINNPHVMVDTIKAHEDAI